MSEQTIPSSTDKAKEDNGSRDRTRALLKEASRLMCEAAKEIQLLRGNNRKDVAYRYADADLGIAIATLEKVRIVMRKRKRNEKQIAAPEASGEAPKAPLGE